MRRAARRSLALLSALTPLGACDERGASAPPPAPPAAEAPPVPTGEWVTVLERTMEGKRNRPEPFATTSDTLRVITAVEPAISPYLPGLVVTNLLSDATAMPVATIRTQQSIVDTITADTVVVQVPAGTLQFFVPEHRGLTGWRVTVQEWRPSR
jgi:hypothetical protein